MPHRAVRAGPGRVGPAGPAGGVDLWAAGRPGAGLVGRVARRPDQPAGGGRPDRGGLARELDVAAVADPARRDGHVAEATWLVVSALDHSDVLLVTSRELRRGRDAAGEPGDLAKGVHRRHRGVRGALPARPAWVVAKGGIITSHDVAVRGLGIRRATVLGQLFPGLVSVFRPLDAAPEAVGTLYVVFAGNVGDETTLAAVIDRFR